MIDTDKLSENKKQDDSGQEAGMRNLSEKQKRIRAFKGRLKWSGDLRDMRAIK